MDEKKEDPTAPPYMPPPYEAQQAYGAQPGYAPPYAPPQPGYPPQGYPPQPGYPPQGYPAQPGYPPAGAPAQPGYPPAPYPGYAPVPTSASPSGVVIQQQPTVVVATAQQKPNNNLPLALVACLCCNGCCLGLAALIYALKSDSAYSAGRADEARQHGEKAKKLAIAGIVIAIIFGVLYAILQTVVVQPNRYAYCGVDDQYC